MLISNLFVALLTALDTNNIQAGIDAATKAGKPYLIPAGTHRVATLRLATGSHIQFAQGAVLEMLPSNADFAPIEKLSFDPHADIETSRFEHALFFASDAERITIEGPGLIACNRQSRGGPKPISMRRCRKVTLKGFTIDRAPNYAISFIASSNIDIGNVKITGSLSDGIDIDASSDVLIHDSVVESHDDAICLKASGSLGQKQSTKNVTVERCQLKTASVFFKLGTESVGDFIGIRARNLKLTGGIGNRHGNPGIALETVDGGTIRNVTIEDIEMDQVGTPIFLRIGNRRNSPGEMSAIRLARITAKSTRYASVIAGLSDAPIRNLTLESIAVDPVGQAGIFDAKRPVPETRAAYPEPIQFGSIPASAFFFRHVVNLKLKAITYLKSAPSPAILLDSVLKFSGNCKEVNPNRLACDQPFR
jgi:polygalacturonase